MGDVGLVDLDVGYRTSSVEEVLPYQGAVLGSVEADEMADTREGTPMAFDRRMVVPGVDEHAGVAVVEVVVERVGVGDVDQGGDGAEPPRAEHRHHVVHPVV